MGLPTIKFLEISDSFLLVTSLMDLTLLSPNRNRLIWGKTVHMKYYYFFVPLRHIGIPIRIDLKLLGELSVSASQFRFPVWPWPSSPSYILLFVFAGI